jgi:hypothetical protein
VGLLNGPNGPQMEIDDDFDITDPLEGTVVFREIVAPLLVTHMFNHAMILSWTLNELCKEKDQRDAVMNRLVSEMVEDGALESGKERRRFEERPSGPYVWQTIVMKTGALWAEGTAIMDEPIEREFNGMLDDLEKLKNEQYKKRGGGNDLMSQVLSIEELAVFMVEHVANGTKGGCGKRD